MAYLVEIYLPSSVDEFADAARRVAAAAADLAGEGLPLRYLHAIFVPEDETCFLLFDAESAHDAASATARAGIAFERIVDRPEAGSVSASRWRRRRVTANFLSEPKNSRGSDHKSDHSRNEAPERGLFHSGLASLSHGRYWARTSDPQLVDSEQRSHPFAPVRLRGVVERNPA
jgi:hypothetical protein